MLLTKLYIKNFKLFDDIEVELGERVLFVGPNNSGKSSALQALALWETGVKRWIEKHGTAESSAKKRSGAVINRKDLVAIPVPNAKLLWKNLHVRRAGKKNGQRHSTENIRIEIGVEGIFQDSSWNCHLEFDYANEESFYVRPTGMSDGKPSEIPPAAREIKVAYLPPMSGLTSNETRLDSGAINVRIGEGRTAEVLRNICDQVASAHPGNWKFIESKMQELFGVHINRPEYIPERGEIRMSYLTAENTKLDLSACGRGQQQTLLLLAYLMANKNTLLLLNEPGAHLEILRQRQIYNVLDEAAAQNNNQIIAASHSEIILNEAADRDLVIAFVGKPHRIDDRGSQVLKALKSIGHEQYYQAEIKGWVLYLEGSTDLAILRAFAKKLRHPVQKTLEAPFVHYTGNQPQKAREHFYGLQEAVPQLQGIAIYDRLDKKPGKHSQLTQLMWEKNEIENYLCTKETLLAYAEHLAEQNAGPLFKETWRNHMNETIQEMETALQSLGKPSPWSGQLKVSDEFLTPLFKAFFKKIGLPNIMNKTDFHRLAKFVPTEQISPEISQKLDAILTASMTPS